MSEDKNAKIGLEFVTEGLQKLIADVDNIDKKVSNLGKDASQGMAKGLGDADKALDSIKSKVSAIKTIEEQLQAQIARTQKAYQLSQDDGAAEKLAKRRKMSVEDAQDIYASSFAKRATKLNEISSKIVSGDISLGKSFGENISLLNQSSRFLNLAGLNTDKYTSAIRRLREEQTKNRNSSSPVKQGTQSNPDVLLPRTTPIKDLQREALAIRNQIATELIKSNGVETDRTVDLRKQLAINQEIVDSTKNKISVEKSYTEQLKDQRAILKDQYAIAKSQGDTKRQETLSAGIAKIDDTLKVDKPVTTVVPEVAKIQRYNQEMASLNATIEQNYRQWKKTGNAADRVKFDKAIVQSKQLQTEMEGFNRAIGKSTSLIGGYVNRVRSHFTWIVSGMMINGIADLFRNMGSLDEQFNQLKTVLPELEVNQYNYNKAMGDSFDLAGKYGTSIKNVTDSLRLMGRGYHDLATTEKLADISLKLGVADNFDPMVATKAIESVVGSYHKQSSAVEFATHVMDSMTKVSHTSQISADDLSKALMRSAAAAHTVGVSYDELTAMTAVVARNTGLSGETVGDGMKSILNSIHSKKAIDELDKLGVSVYKFTEDGKQEFRSISDVLLEVGIKAQTTDKNFEGLFKQLSGGKFQVTKLAALLGDPAEYIRVLSSSINSAGFTDKQIATQLDTLTRKVQQLKIEFERLLTTGGTNAGFTNTIKNILSVMTRMISGLNQIPALVYGGATSFAVMAGAVYGVARAIRALNAAHKTLNLTMKSNPWTLVASLVAGATFALYDYLNAENALLAKRKEAKQASEDELTTRQKEVDQMEQQIPFLSTLGEAYTSIQEQKKNAEVGSEKYNKCLKDEQTITDALTATVGEDSAKQILSSEDVNAALENQAKVMKSTSDSKKEELRLFRIALANDLQAQADHFSNCAIAYKRDVDAFTANITGKIRMLGIFNAALMTANEWQSAGLRNQQAFYQKIADSAPEGSKQKESAQKTVNELNDHIAGLVEENENIKNGPYNSYVQKAIDAQNQANSTIQASTGTNTNRNTGEAESPESKSKGGSGGGGSSPSDNSTKQLRDERKMAQEAMFYRAKIAADKYTAALDELNTKEEIYGATVDSTISKLALKQDRAKELQNQASEYANERDYLASEIDTEIGQTPELLNLVGVAQSDWNAMTKDQRTEIKGINKELLQQNALIKTSFELSLKYGEKYSEAIKDSQKIRNEYLKESLGDTLDPSKRNSYNRSMIDANTGIAKAKVNDYDPLGYKKNIEIELIAEKEKYAILEQEGKKLTDDLVKYRSDKYKQAAIEAAESAASSITNDPNKSATEKADAYRLAQIRINQIQSNNTDEIRKNTLARKQNEQATLESLKKQKDLSNQTNQEIKQFAADSFLSMAQNGKKFKDIMKEVWNTVAKDAINALMRINTTSSGIGTKIMGATGKGKSGSSGVSTSGINTGSAAQASAMSSNWLKFANGGIADKPSICGEDGKEAVVPLEKNTGNSANILNYAARSLGVSLGTKEYSPYFKNQSLASNPIVNVTVQQQNDSIKELQEANALMRQQNNLLLNSNGSSSPTIVTTAVSSEQVLQVLAQNPDALQRILGNNKSKGWR